MIVNNVPLWSVTTWDKKYNAVDKSWQPQTIKYKYLLSDELDKISVEGGNVRLLYTGKDIGYTTETLAGDALSEGEIVAIPWGGAPSVKYFKGKFVTGDNRIATSNNPDELLNKYLYYYLLGHLKELSSYYRGAGLKHPSMKDVLKMRISYPSVEVQKQIIKQFDLLLDIVEMRRQQQQQQLDELVKARFVEMFGDPMTNSKGYVLRKYGDVFELNAGGTPSKQKPEYWENGTVSWIGSNMCQNTVIYENDGNYITEEGLEHSSARMFPVGTVLIALVGATMGKTALLRFETTTNQNVLGVRRIRESGYTPEFIFYYTQGLYQKFLNIGDGGFAMASKGFISKLPVPVVDLTAQEQFTAFVEQVYKSKVAVQKALDEAQTLFDSLMQQYFG